MLSHELECSLSLHELQWLHDPENLECLQRDQESWLAQTAELATLCCLVVMQEMRSRTCT